MKEKPSWYRGTVEGESDPSLTQGNPEVVADPVLEELLAEKQFIIDSAPEGWENEIDPVLLQEFRTQLIGWSVAEILKFSRNNDIWSDPTYAKALLDVLSGKITKPLN